MKIGSAYYFSEGKKYNAVSPDNKDIIRLISEFDPGFKLYTKFDATKEEIKFRVCGVIALNDILVVIFPKGYYLDPDATTEELTQGGRLLFNVFQQYMEDNTQEWETQKINMGDAESDALSRITEIVYMLRDFRQNGYLIRKSTKISQQRTGHVLWNKTIRQSQPVFSHRQAIYPAPYMQSDVCIRNQMVQKIHRYLICKLRNDWGWIYDDNFPVSRIPQPPCNMNDALAVLSDELRHTFVYREINLIQCMIRYIKKLHGHTRQIQSDFLLTSNFDSIWEQICKKVLGDVYTQVLKDIVPKPLFTPVDNDPEGLTGQIPDVICISHNQLFVLDAKNYDITETFPHWSDFTKQFFYFYTIKERLESIQKESEHLPMHLQKYKYVYPAANALLLPCYRGRSTLSGPAYYGVVRIPWSPSLGAVHICLLNAQIMMKAYVRQISYQPVREELFAELNHRSKI